MLIASFPPILTAQAKVLILGSMPGARSLARQQYYAHPLNQFWPLMGKLFGIDPQLPYLDRIAKLSTTGVALWDVLKFCEREGSLDANIVSETEVPNDFQSLLDAYPLIRAIGFNGKKAEQSFFLHVKPSLKTETIARLDLMGLPSTSPANRRMDLATKLAKWQIILQYLSDAPQLNP